jgi:hypothetical protein
VVVYRTAARLAPHQHRTVCTVPVFGKGAGALENSLVGSGRSLIAENTYGYDRDLTTMKLNSPSKPGFARIDIAANGNSCRKVWANNTLASTVSARLSTRTGLIYTVSRKFDTHNYPSPGLDVYYWTALDFRTGKVMWQRQAGTGFRFDSLYPGAGIGPTGTAYLGAYGGIIAIKDTP